MEDVLKSTTKVKSGYGPPRKGFEDFLKSCQPLQPLYTSTAYPTLCTGYCIPEGLWLHDLMIQPYYDSRVLKSKKSDVFVSAFPKTGTTWTQEITFLVMNNADTELANRSPLEDRSPFLEIPIIGLKGIDAQDEPRLIKTHLPYELLPPDFLASKTKIVYIARNPKDTVISLYNFMKMVRNFSFTGTLEEFVDLFVSGKVLYSSYAEHVLSYWNRRNDDNVLFLTYEGLQKDLLGGIGKVAQFLDKQLNEDQLVTIAKHCSFDSMSKNPMTNYSQSDSVARVGDTELSFMRKGKVGDWKNKFTDAMNQKMDGYVEKHFSGSGCEFEYEI